MAGRRRETCLGGRIRIKRGYRLQAVGWEIVRERECEGERWLVEGERWKVEEGGGGSRAFGF